MEPAFSWTPGRVDDLKRMIAAGESATQIAKHLGCPSRNAVLGKAYRLGLSTKAAPNWVREEGRAKAHLKPDKPKAVAKPVPKPIALRPPPAPVVQPLPPSEAPAAGSVGLMKLRLCDCRWPYGDGPFLFCGQPVETIGKPYCAAHTEKARSKRGEP